MKKNEIEEWKKKIPSKVIEAIWDDGYDSGYGSGYDFSKLAVRAAVEKVLPCYYEIQKKKAPAMPNSGREVIPFIKSLEPCPNCRARAAILEGLK
jgi:hypothetical protein